MRSHIDMVCTKLGASERNRVGVSEHKLAGGRYKLVTHRTTGNGVDLAGVDDLEDAVLLGCRIGEPCDGDGSLREGFRVALGADRRVLLTFSTV